MICLVVDLFVRLTSDRNSQYCVEIRMGWWRFSPVLRGSPAPKRLDRHARWTLAFCVFAAIGIDGLVFFASGCDYLIDAWISGTTCVATVRGVSVPFRLSQHPLPKTALSVCSVNFANAKLALPHATAHFNL